MATPARVTELFTTISENNDLRQRLTAASDEIARIDILASAGFNDITLADIHAALPTDDTEINDAELSEVAGGKIMSVMTIEHADLMRELFPYKGGYKNSWGES